MTLAATAKTDADREKLVAEQVANANTQAEVMQRLAQRFFASNLRPLSPEVLGWSIMRRRQEFSIKIASVPKWMPIRTNFRLIQSCRLHQRSN